MNSTEKLKSLLNTLFVLLTIFTPKKIHKNLSKLFGKVEDQIQILISENFLLQQKITDENRETELLQVIGHQKQQLDVLQKELKKQNHIEIQTDFKAFTMVFNLLINADYYKIGFSENEYFISNKYGNQYFKNLNQVITHLKSQNKIQTKG